MALLAGNMFDDRGDDKVNRRNALVVLKGVEGCDCGRTWKGSLW